MGMIFAHTVQILFIYNDKGGHYFFRLISTFVDITTFSVFVFCFGYVYQLAYFKNINESRRKILKSGYNTLIVYYISAFCSKMTFSNFTFSSKSVLDILFFFDIPGYCEFLLAFAGISFLCFFFGKTIIFILDNRFILLSLCLFFFLLPFVIPYEKIPIQLGIFIGSSQYFSFPLLQYFPFFLFGASICKHKISFNIPVFISCLSLSIIALIYFIQVYGFTFFLHISSLRFPPSFFWLIFPSLYVYVLYLLAKKISRFNLGVFIKRMGANTLTYLLFSNIILFMLKKLAVINYSWYAIFIVTFFILFICNHLLSISRK